MKSKIKLSVGLVAAIIIIMSSCGGDETAKQNPIIIWENPTEMKYGSSLGDTQLNATADVAGTFIYTPEQGTILEIGEQQELMVNFIPSETSKYNTISNTVFINVLPNGTSSSKFNSSLEYGTVNDADGNAYKTIEIGNQIWMAENLRTTKYRNGDEINEVTNNSDWVKLTSAAFSNYENISDLDHQATYGRLYNWFAVSDSRNLAPEGWHVATKEDWEQIANSLGGLESAGGKLKEASNAHWNSPNTAANNSSGFTALPSGRREYTDGSSINLGYNAFWWTSSAYNPDYSWYFQLNYDNGTVIPANFHKQYGFSVRCVKD